MHTIHSMPTSGNGRLSRRVLAGQTTQRGAITAQPRPALSQPLARIAIVGALALLLAGSIAAPAGAMKRSQVVRIVNGAIGLCFSSGGYPDVEESPVNGGFSVACYWDDGSSAWGWYDYEDEDQGEPPVRGRPDSRSARAADSVTADNTGDGASDTADHGRQKAHKQKKHKAKAGKHGNKHRR